MNPETDSHGRPRLGLALSGGGFRAMLFHTGAVWRLNEMGLLSSISTISSVSGGSLFSGRLATRWDRLRFQHGVATNYQEEVAEPVIKFARRNVDVWSVALGFIPFLSAGRVASWFYRWGLVGDARLNQLPSAPVFVFNATHLPTGTTWRFTKAFMAGYRVGMIRNPDVPLATVLAASAAFPPFLSPVILRTDPSSYAPDRWPDLSAIRSLREQVPLTDGGVYDNLGLQALDSFEEVLVSDGGGGLTVDTSSFKFWFTQLRRVLDIAVEQDRALRRRHLLEDFTSTPPRKRGALWRTKTDITNREGTPRPPALPVHPGWPTYMFGIRTRLNPFSDFERFHLVNWGYLVADSAVGNWYLPDHPPATTLPYPDFDFAQAPPGTAPAAGPTTATTALENNFN
jgi:NTE family protein